MYHRKTYSFVALRHFVPHFGNKMKQVRVVHVGVFRLDLLANFILEHDVRRRWSLGSVRVLGLLGPTFLLVTLFFTSGSLAFAAWNEGEYKINRSVHKNDDTCSVDNERQS